MSTGWIITLIVIGVLVAILVVLYFLGKKAQKKQAEQQVLLEQNKQTVSMLIIDKKRMKMKDSGLPAMVMEQTPKLMRNSKLPIVKAKVGPQTVSGIYILDVKGLHGKLPAAPVKKKGFFKRALETAQEKAGAKPVK